MAPDSVFPELIFSRPDHAAMMAHYHFANVLILLNRPNRPHGNPIIQLREYRDLMKNVEADCREICGIANGRPHAAARINLIQPLYLAGQCLEGGQERKPVIQLLRDIQLDTGWSTEYRVKELLNEYHGSDQIQVPPHTILPTALCTL
ncbi:hypothetical protein NA57DRAFT_75455 [Rhizodiscina lignyota]|uniref:Uncharacterized protein n=1 Tax=Rhizodiscina lignyota TaxID=1504668 RepID=A0A9P4MBQ5_9PEZI|nr:hypothetical protein NA57DRAFT_75455 [Rhizodiscina lignyota]